MKADPANKAECCDIYWWLVTVTLVVDWLFLPQIFGPVVGTYEGLLWLCECTSGGGSFCRWWGHLTMHGPKSRAAVDYTLSGVEPHGSTRGVWPMATVAKHSQSYFGNNQYLRSCITLVRCLNDGPRVNHIGLNAVTTRELPNYVDCTVHQ